MAALGAGFSNAQRLPTRQNALYPLFRGVDISYKRRSSGAFRDFCKQRIANLLEQSKQVLQVQYANSTSSPLNEAPGKDPTDLPVFVANL